MIDMTRLPSLVIPDELYELIRVYAFNNRIKSISEAVRELLKQSPPLIELAKDDSIDLNELNVREWGKGREKQETPEPPAVESDKPPTPKHSPPEPGWQGKPSPKPGQK